MNQESAGFLGELEHLKIETRLIDEMFPSVMDEYVFLKCNVIRKIVCYESIKQEVKKSGLFIMNQ
jgi:hypothetical protein